MAGTVFRDVGQAEISAVPGPLAELVVAYLDRTWIQNNMLWINAVTRPASIFLNLALPDEGIGKIITQIQSDFWVSFRKECKTKSEDPDYPDKKADLAKFRQKMDSVVAFLKDHTGEFGKKIAEWHASGALDAQLEKIKGMITKFDFSAVKDKAKKIADGAKDLAKNGAGKIIEARDRLDSKFEPDFWDR